MLAWRLCRAPFADLSGLGARQYGGRWSSPGRPVVYAASSAALCILEVRVHLDIPPELVPDDYVLMRIDLGTLPVEVVGDLPADPCAFGDAWLRDGRTPVLQVPSVVAPDSVNVLLNPLHPLAVAATVAEVRPFAFDRRLWLPL